jgi:hypothetical protein
LTKLDVETQETSFGHRVFQFAAIAAVLAYFGVLLRQVGGMIHGLAQAAAALSTALAAYAAADFVSGFVHWMGDRLGSEQTPVLGPNFVGPFRYHHVDPEGITRHGFVETNGNNSIVLAPVLIAAAHLGPRLLSGWSLLLADAFIVFFGLAIFATNQFHKWAHVKSPSAPVAALQRWGLILGYEHHQTHHTSPYDTYYCITAGWLNPVLDRLRFFERIEGLLWAAFGIKAGEDAARSVLSAAP